VPRTAPSQVQKLIADDRVNLFQGLLRSLFVDAVFFETSIEYRPCDGIFTVGMLI
jgi:hypothetical protein